MLLELGEVAVPRDEVGIVARGARVIDRGPSWGGVRMEELPPHVDAEASEDGPLEDVCPRERIAADRSRHLDDEGGDADGQAEHEAEVDPSSVLAGQTVTVGTRWLLVTLAHSSNRT